jgi:hypothetical protein
MSHQVQGTPQGHALACLPGALEECVCPFPGLDHCSHGRRPHCFASQEGVLTHLKTYHGFPSFWSQRVYDPVWAVPLASILTAARHWLCMGCLRVFPFRTRSCSSCGVPFFCALSAIHPPPDTPVLVPPSPAFQPSMPVLLSSRRITSRRRPRSPSSAPTPSPLRRRSSTRPPTSCPTPSLLQLPANPSALPSPSPTSAHYTWDVALLTRVFSLRVP